MNETLKKLIRKYLENKNISITKSQYKGFVIRYHNVYIKEVRNKIDLVDTLRIVYHMSDIVKTFE